MNDKIVVSCFDYTTNFVKPWADAGYLCYCVDRQHPPGETRKGNIVLVGADMMHWLPPHGDIAFAAFFTPCTDVAVSGARWFRDKGLGKLIDALSLFKRSVDLAELMGAPYLIENPVSTVSSYWRKPDHTFDPCDYGDPYTKKKHAYGLGTDSSCRRNPRLLRVSEARCTFCRRARIAPTSEAQRRLASQTLSSSRIAALRKNYERRPQIDRLVSGQRQTVPRRMVRTGNRRVLPPPSRYDRNLLLGRRRLV